MKLYKKIDIYIFSETKNQFVYLCSTNRSKTCRDAKTNFLKTENGKLLTPEKIKAYFA
jgi:hypothetical protein